MTMMNEEKDKVNQEMNSNDEAQKKSTEDQQQEAQGQAVKEEQDLPEEELLKIENEALKKKIEEQKDKYLRLYADYDNFRKRSAKDRLELTDQAGKDLILKLLPVLDDFERAVTAAEKTQDANLVKEGLNLIYKKLWNALQSNGLKKMETIGEPFNAELHEAVTEIEAGKDSKGKVVDEIEGGFYLKDKIIRFAKVVVGK